MRTAIANRQGRIAGRVEERTDHSRGPESVIDQISRLLASSAERAGVPWTEIHQVAIGAPGPLDRVEGVIYSPPNMPGWATVPLADRLRRILGVPVALANDANAAALGEYRFGAGRGAENIIYLTVSTGIGSGIIAGGRLIEGRSNMAGEIGHTTIDRFGPRCPCGNIGCLEFIASGTSIARRYREATAAKGTEVLARGADDVARRAADGDVIAASILTDAMHAIGIGVVNLVNIFNPEVVAIGGGVANLGPALFDTVRDVVRERALPEPASDVRVMPAELGEDVGLIGAAAVALTDEEFSQAPAAAAGRLRTDA